MKTIQIHKADFNVIIIGDGVSPTPRAWLFTKQVESIPTVQKGQRLKWIPDDAENPQGQGALQAVDVPIPVPTEVLTYKVFGQLAKEVMQGDDEQMQAALTQAGTMTNLLMEMTKAAPEEQIPAAMKPVALNEIERTQTIQRAHPFIDLYGPAFGYATEEEKDQFFIRAQAYKFGV